MSALSTRFTRKWREFVQPSGISIYRPMLPVLVRGRRGFIERDFLVDSGADLAMAPQEFCRQLGLRWQDGAPIALRGISQRKVCLVQGRINDTPLVARL